MLEAKQHFSVFAIEKSRNESSISRADEDDTGWEQLASNGPETDPVGP